MIEKLEGLEELKNLVWLDLSFNNIEKIEGFDNLTKLEDLSLFNNKIERIENMNALEQLQVFSLGNNHISDLDNVIYLRGFKSLHSLTLNGNPVAEDERYRNYTIAFLPHLIYLDYSFVEENMKATARNMFEVDIEKLEQVDAESCDLQISSQENLRVLEKEAFVDRIKGILILEEMFSNDQEGELLRTIPSNKIALEEYSKSLNTCCEHLYQYGLQKYEERQCELLEFEKFLNETKQHNKEQATAEIDKFIASKNEVLHVLLMNSNAKADLDLQRIEELKAALFLVEVQLVDQIEESMKDFEQNLQDLINDFNDQVRSELTKCRNLESDYHNKISIESLTVFEKVLANEIDDEFLTGNLAQILMDKDTLQNSAKSSFETHLQILDNLEDEVINVSNKWMKTYLQEVQRSEVIRNRTRILEIIHLIESLREEDFDMNDQ